MQTNRMTASPSRAVVRRLGRLSTGGRGRTGLGEAVRWWGGGVAGDIGRLVGRGAAAEGIIGAGGADANRSPAGTAEVGRVEGEASIRGGGRFAGAGGA